jgi:hypothetical protein
MGGRLSVVHLARVKAATKMKNADEKGKPKK